MNIERLELVLYDFTGDIWWPPQPLVPKWKNEFEHASYSQWAIDTLKGYVVNKLYHRREGSIDEFIEIVEDFQIKMSRYASYNRENGQNFRVAEQVTADILEVLRAMR